MAMIKANKFVFGHALSWRDQPYLRSLFDEVGDPARQVTVVFGAGVSMNSGLPSWLGLLTNMAAELPPDLRDLAASDTSDPLRKAERLLHLALTSDNRKLAHEVVRDALYPIGESPAPGETAQALARLWRALDGRLALMTTNFDGLAEEALAALGAEPSSRAVKQHTQWKREVDAGHASVMHLHGLIRVGDEPRLLEPLVLSESDFLEHGPQVRKLVAERIATSTTIFVGVSLTDPNLVAPLFSRTRTSTQERGGVAPSGSGSCYALVVPDEVPAATTQMDEVTYNLRSAAFLEDTLHLRPIFLKSFSQVTQVISELGLHAADPTAYAAGTTPARAYGPRLDRQLDDIYAALGLPADSDVPRTDSIARNLTAVFADIVEGDDGPLAFLREWAHDHLAPTSADMENVGAFLWLRSREAPDGVSPYALSLVCNTAYSYRAEWARRRRVVIRRDSGYTAALAVYRGASTAANLSPGPGLSLWRGSIAYPLVVPGPDGGTDAGADYDRMLVGAVTLNTSRLIKSVEGDPTPVSLISQLDDDDSARLEQITTKAIATLIKKRRSKPDPGAVPATREDRAG